MAKKRLYELTDADRAQLEPWRDRWIANAMSTSPMTAEEWTRTVEAVERLYRAANLTPPPRERIVLTSSPMVARFAAGYAAAIWYARKAWGAYTEGRHEGRHGGRHGGRLVCRKHWLH